MWTLCLKSEHFYLFCIIYYLALTNFIVFYTYYFNINYLLYIFLLFLYILYHLLFHQSKSLVICLSLRHIRQKLHRLLNVYEASKSKTPSTTELPYDKCNVSMYSLFNMEYSSKSTTPLPLQ